MSACRKKMAAPSSLVAKNNMILLSATIYHTANLLLCSYTGANKN